MDLSARIRDLSATYNALIDLGKNKLPFSRGTKDPRIELLLMKGYVVPGITRVTCLDNYPSVTVDVQHYRRTPEGQRALFFAELPEKIIGLPSKIISDIYDLFHPD